MKGTNLKSSGLAILIALLLANQLAISQKPSMNEIEKLNTSNFNLKNEIKQLALDSQRLAGLKNKWSQEIAETEKAQQQLNKEASVVSYFLTHLPFVQIRDSLSKIRSENNAKQAQLTALREKKKTLELLNVEVKEEEIKAISQDLQKEREDQIVLQTETNKFNVDIQQLNEKLKKATAVTNENIEIEQQIITQFNQEVQLIADGEAATEEVFSRLDEEKEAISLLKLPVSKLKDYEVYRKYIRFLQPADSAINIAYNKELVSRLRGQALTLLQAASSLNPAQQKKLRSYSSLLDNYCTNTNICRKTVEDHKSEAGTVVKKKDAIAAFNKLLADENITRYPFLKAELNRLYPMIEKRDGLNNHHFIQCY